MGRARVNLKFSLARDFHLRSLDRRSGVYNCVPTNCLFRLLGPRVTLGCLSEWKQSRHSSYLCKNKQILSLHSESNSKLYLQSKLNWRTVIYSTRLLFSENLSCYMSCVSIEGRFLRLLLNF